MAVAEEKLELGLVQYSRQCLLKRPSSPEDFVYLTTWIPEKFAKLDAMLRIDEEPLAWRVVTVGMRLSIEYLGQFKDDYRHQGETGER